MHSLKLRDSRGFTLIEIMVVVVILGKTLWQRRDEGSSPAG